MKNNLLIILLVLIVITILIICIFIFLIKKTHISKYKRIQIQKLGESISINPLDKMSATLTRVNTISQNDDNFSKLFKRLTKKYDEIDEKLKSARTLLSDLSVNYKNINKKEFNESAVKIREYTKSVSLIENQFDIDSKRIVQQDEFVRSEFIHLQSNLRKIIDVYKIKKLFMKDIVPYTDKLLDKTEDIQKVFSDFLEKGDATKIYEQINIFKEYILKIAIIIDKAPSVQTYLSKTIPEKTKDLLAIYKHKKSELKTDFKNLNFLKSVEEIKNKYLTAKKRFTNGSIKNTVASIKQILKSLKMMERMINIEIQSRNIFIQNYKMVVDSIKESFTLYIVVKYDLKNMSKDLLVQELKETFIDLKNESKQIDVKSLDFLNLVKNMDIPFSSKLARMKIILKELNIFITKINETSSLIWEHKNNNLMIKNKYIRMVNAIEKLEAEIKNEKIITSDDEKNKLNFIDNQLMEISKFIDFKIINDKQTRIVNIFLERGANYYKIVNAKSMMAKLIKDLIYKLSSRRSIDSSVNITVESAERKYLQGKYASALNILISMMEEE
ncbi:septation ring formation regulator EzrA [Candidatus Mycoplasma mahonii]|uniref:septation ring formation regulator EzrA n=1 Tax=Candidatus Mycoplasma mahonii TaxID=3004105 RepID=UPI0026EAE158|nr:septation ring formation regulator EzrA [Candidatus Mycoplasma mahonii]WKX02695.1 hypothetical protein O3I44_01305 [Candidatus Mycoplasma mahonii]